MFPVCKPDPTKHFTKKGFQGPLPLGSDLWETGKNTSVFHGPEKFCREDIKKSV